MPSPFDFANRRLRGRVFLFAAAATLLLTGCTNTASKADSNAAAPASPAAVAAPAGSRTSPYGFDANRSFADLTAQVAFGPRYPGAKNYPASPGYAKMRDWLVKALTDASGVQAKRQDFTMDIGDRTLSMSNVYAAINPQAKTQILLCAHWDTRPTADQEIDPEKKKMPIPGADDGASGVAALLELARVFKAKAPTVGVQIMFFDGEDYGPGDDRMYLGARKYADDPPLPKPTYAILIDMIGAKDLVIYRERQSEDRDADIDDKVWGAAASLHVSSFQDSVKYDIYDDHLPLQKAGIRAIDLIDFDYGQWHTLDDTPEHCSPQSLQDVGDVLAKVVYDEK